MSPSLLSLQRRLAVALCAVVAALGCGDDAELPDGVHVWGRYALCVRRVSDSCGGSSEGGCLSVAADDSRRGTLATRLGTGEFFWARPGLPPVRGQQQGTRFQVVGDWVELPDVCGCRARVRETVRAELLLRVPADQPACVDTTDPEAPACEGPAPHEDGWDAQWLERAGDVPADPAQRFEAVRGRIVNELEPVPGEQNCSCLPCRIEYELTGRQ